MSIPTNIDILPPWKIIEGLGNRSELLSAQLETELPQNHVLHGLKVTAVAARIDRDDVLFEVVKSETPLAVVHMTRGKETDPRWPGTKLFRSWEHWAQEDMQPAHEDYGP
jgi:hypothetical protein